MKRNLLARAILKFIANKVFGKSVKEICGEPDNETTTSSYKTKNMNMYNELNLSQVKHFKKAKVELSTYRKMLFELTQQNHMFEEMIERLSYSDD